MTKLRGASIKIAYESNRLAKTYLANAYERLMPIRKYLIDSRKKNIKQHQQNSSKNMGVK